jgi:hypothetical protein
MHPPSRNGSRRPADQRAAAIASIEEGWRIAKETGLDKITDEEIDAEIAIVRAELLRRRKSAPRS